MGELMRWRLARAPQRQAGLDAKSSISLPEPPPRDLALIESLGRLEADSVVRLRSELADRFRDVPTFKTYLRSITAKQSGQPAARSGRNIVAAALDPFDALNALDEWLAANAPLPTDVPPYATPSVAGLQAQITALVGPSLPQSWAAMKVVLLSGYGLTLIHSADPDSSVDLQQQTELLAAMTRMILVMYLVEDVVAGSGNVQTPDDIYYALRWRTIVLSDSVTTTLEKIRNRDMAAVVRRPAFADLYITREEWDHYEAAEIASIENVLGGELKKHVHVLVNQTTSSVTTDTTTSSVTERDTTTTDLAQLQNQSTQDISIAAHVGAQVDVSGQAGPMQISTHLEGSLDYSSASSTSKAVTQSHETVARAVNRVEQSTRVIRTVSTLSRTTDKEDHRLDNTGNQTPIVGVYRWVVDQIKTLN